MATGGGKGGAEEDNPFSFKKFIKKTSKEKTDSDSEWEDESDEEPVLDLLDTSDRTVENKKENSEPKVKKSDENPFSFKRFLQSSGGPKQMPASSNGCGRIATLDLANDLPDFVQDHYLNDRELSRSRSRNSAAEVCLPDFALDSAGASGHVTDCPPDIYDSAGDMLNDGYDNPRPKVINMNGHLRENPSSDNDSSIRDAKMFEPNVDTYSFVTTSRSQLLHSMNSGGGGDVGGGDKGGGLPDFISDSALGVYNAPANASGNETFASTSDGHRFHMTDEEENKSILNQLQEENQDLRRRLNEAREVAQTQTSRAEGLLKDIENLRKHEAEETAALEKMVQQVEANLQTTTQRAVHAENTIAKLNKEIKSLQSQMSSVKAENALLRSTNCNSLKDKALQASQQITSAATNAEQLLKQLLTGVETLKMVSSFLASTDQVRDIPSEDPVDNNKGSHDKSS